MPGVADLPLHHGRVPEWMWRIMRRLGSAIVEYMVEVRGPSSIVALARDPLWLQAFSNVIGMDWDSSGSTTVALRVLKEAALEKPWLGFAVLGGKGGEMLMVPEEAVETGERLDVDPDWLVRVSKLAARADSAFLQDGYTLYIHALIVSEDGDAAVVQQGMRLEDRMARRYHVSRWELEEPHYAVAGVPGRVELNATAREARRLREVMVDLAREDPRRIIRQLQEANRRLEGRPTLLDYIAPSGEGRGGRPRYYRPVRPSKQLLRSLEAVHEWSPTTPEELALAPRLGPATVRALALIADVIYGVPASTRDPVTQPLDPYAYAYAVGGKDGVPYPFNPRIALEAIRILEEAVEHARLGDKAKQRSLERLRRLARRLAVQGEG